MNAQRRYIPKATPNSAARQALAAMREVPFPEPRQCAPEQVSEVDKSSSAETEDICEGKADDDCDDLIDSITTDKTNMPKGKFRVCNEKFLLTYKTHLDKTEVLNFFKTLKKSVDLDEVIVAHEVASSKTNYEHSHVFVSFKAAFTSVSQRIFDIDGIHPNIKVITSKKHLQHIWRYLCKEDHSNDHLLSRITQETIFDMICNQKTANDALRLAKNPSEASGILLMYRLREKEAIPYEQPKHTWQKQLAEEIIDRPASKRSIIWVCGKSGNEGKTTFADFMELGHQAYNMNSFAGDANVGMNLQSARDNGWNARYLIVDLTRQCEEYKSIYSALEKAKNGKFTCTKYGGGDLRFKQPTIVCFANYWPNIHAMSKDRWDLREIVPQGTHEDGDQDYVFCSKSISEILKELESSQVLETIKHNFNRLIEEMQRSNVELSLEETTRIIANRLLSMSSWSSSDPSSTSLTGR